MKTDILIIGRCDDRDVDSDGVEEEDEGRPRMMPLL